VHRDAVADRASGAAAERRINDYAAAAVTFEGALSREECMRIRELAARLPLVDFDYYPAPATPVRRADTRRLSFGDCGWLADRLREFAQQANARFAFEIDAMPEAPLVVAYPVGGFLAWHTDLGTGEESTRKISLSVQLSEPHEYEGGCLQMVCCDEPLSIPAIGTLAAFPSHLAHRVSDVTRGERLALVTWIHGPAFR
jgi:PKHD-type hydroxylase